MIQEKINYNNEDLQSHHGIAAVIINDKDEILMLDHVKFNFFTIPVGKVKPEETVEEALIVELGEELNITPIEYEEILIYSKVYTRNNKEINVTTHIFIIQKYTGELRNNEPHKHRSIKWMSLKEINNLDIQSNANINMLKYFKDNGDV